MKKNEVVDKETEKSQGRFLWVSEKGKGILYELREQSRRRNVPADRNTNNPEAGDCLVIVRGTPEKPSGWN